MYDVFISYSSRDEAEAKRICGILEENDVSCWLAPINIRAHHNFAADIPRAIRKSRVYLLLMSETAQKSKWVPRELVWADKHDLPIFTLFIENCKLQETFEFILTTNQYHGYSDDKESEILHMIREIKDYLENGDNDDDDTPCGHAVSVSSPAPEPVKKNPWKKPLLIAAAFFITVALIVGGFTLFGGSKKPVGYVIWAPEYGIAMTGDMINSHYLAGEKIGVTNGLPTSYSDKCIWQVTFKDDGTFTISRDGLTLGVEPGYNGIGLGGNYTSDLWQISDTDGDICYIQNADSKYLLEWYADKDNWATHGKVTDANRNMFRLRMDPVQ